MMSEPTIESLSYEEAYKALEEILQLLEDNTLSLEESMRLFGRAQGLLAHCEKILQAAEIKVKQYNNGQWEDKTFSL